MSEETPRILEDSWLKQNRWLMELVLNWIFALIYTVVVLFLVFKFLEPVLGGV